MSEAFLDPSARLRQMLESRREKSAAAMQRIPFVLDQQISDDVERIANHRQRLEDRLAYLADVDAERDPEDPAADVRATGEDLSDIGQEIASTQAELERVAAELEQVVEAAKQATVYLLFRRLDAVEYERELIRAGGALVDTDAAASYKFHDALLAAAFTGVELADGDDGGMRTWREFVEATSLSFGELDPIRALVYASNRRGGNSVPFWSAPSRKTANS